MCDLAKELALTDAELAEKFKREHNEQFNVLVRMHLSFLLDLATDENDCTSDKSKQKKWSLVPFNKKCKYRGVIEGAPLTQEGICQVYQLIEFLKVEKNIKVEGIFRRTGSLARQHDLKNLLNQGKTLELESSNYTIHDCASVLKGFLAELPDPLLTEVHYPAYCQIAALCGVAEKTTQDEKLLVALQLLLLLLPTENKVLLKDILDILNLTASYESCNRMSAENLATLFTPHLLCPRKLSPEKLHDNSRTLSGIVTFMINHPNELFEIPQKLALDFRARYYEKSKWKQHSRVSFDESVGDQFAANTVFTFTDHERTSKENNTNTTETALAQLYAHIQSMPESSKKRKLVKHFNKENGHGTPLQVIRSGAGEKSNSRTLGDSIKKHIFHRSGNKQLKKSQGVGLHQKEVCVMTTPPAPAEKGFVRARLFCPKKCESSPESSPELKKRRQSNSPKEGESAEVGKDFGVATPSKYVTSTPAPYVMSAVHPLVFTPEAGYRKSMSPISRSTQRMTRAMQETMMTPRSRKPVLLVSGSNINAFPKKEEVSVIMDKLPEEERAPSPMPDKVSPNTIASDGSGCESENDIFLTQTFKDYLRSRSMLTTAVDSSFSSRTDDFNSTDFINDNGLLSNSLLNCLNGHNPGDHNSSHLEESGDDDSGSKDEKKLTLKPKQFDENGQAIVFETSF